MQRRSTRPVEMDMEQKARSRSSFSRVKNRSISPNFGRSHFKKSSRNTELSPSALEDGEVMMDGRPFDKFSGRGREICSVNRPHLRARSRSVTDVSAVNDSDATDILDRSAKNRKKIRNKAHFPKYHFDKTRFVEQFRAALAARDHRSCFYALLRLSVKGGFDWVHQNLSEEIHTLEDTLWFCTSLIDCWKDAFRKENHIARQKSLSWLIGPLSSLLVQVCRTRFHLLCGSEQERLRKIVLSFGECIPAVSWSVLVMFLQLPVPEDEHLIRARLLLQDTNHLNDAFHFIKNLSLQNLLKFEEMISPFVFEKQLKLAADLVKDDPDLQHQFILFLRPIDAKFAYRIVLENELDPKRYLEIEATAKLPTLRWLMQQHKLVEFAEEICGDNIGLQCEVLKMTLRSKHVNEFVFLFEKFGAGAGDDDMIRAYREYQLAPFDVPTPSVDNVNLVDYLTLPVPLLFEPDNTILEQCLNNTTLIGIDAEYKPTFCNFVSGTPAQAAVLQLSSQSVSIVLDMCKPLSKERANIIRGVFRNPNILKLGFAIRGDIRALSATFTDTDCFSLVSPVLDLQKVARHLDVSGDQKLISLSKLCEAVLHKPLCKTEQVSNWGIRPLRKEQLSYCALDAYCLTDLYSKIVDRKLLSSAIKVGSEEIVDDLVILHSMHETISDARCGNVLHAMQESV
uniref:3'-5' exonuclease domain-containing protein n=1 Tax=Spongospora subterranea TaxID=70186 RepID=A0A0H5RNM4_9EUKA|eukprot:CRZ10324.1 hypothetical protein [Spongospora subterranea]